jgi:hypothetical protein
MRVPVLSAAALLGWTTLAGAQVPTAIVESVNGQVVGAEFMDYVVPGQVIKLGASGTIVLAYLASCTRETIKGGVAVVGTDESRTSLAEVSREKSMCDPVQPTMISGTSAGGGMAFRNPPRKSSEERRQTIYSLTPVIEVAEGGTLVVERIDRPGERYETALSPQSLVKGKFLDFEALNRRLQPGGLYAATLGSRKAVFKVDQLAEPAGPLLGRLLRL